MYQIDNSTAVATIPASTSAGIAGFFTDGNPATGVAATIMPAEFMNMVMMEIINVLGAAGVTPSKSNFTQLLTAIKAVGRQAVILADTGSAGAYAAANSPALTTLPASGYMQRLNIANSNTGASTYSPDGLSPKPIYGLGLQPLQGGELPAGIAVLMYLVQAGVNGGNGAWVVIESLGGASQIAPATKSLHATQAAQIQNASVIFAATSGSANAQTANIAPAPTAYVGGMILSVLASYTNTGAMTINVNSLGAVPVQGSAGALQGGEVVFGGNYLLQYNSLISGFKILAQVGGALQVPPAVASTHAVPLAQSQSMFSGVVGSMRNAKMNIAAASASGTFTADEIIVESVLGGQTYRLANFNKTVNLASTGANGMDTGTPPASGFVSIYAIYNPTTATAALLACNQTTSSGNVYTGANMPAGYTASALVSAWPTTAASLFVIGLQIDRKINIALTLMNSSSANQSNTSISIAAIVPIAAKEISGILQVGSSAASNCTISLSGTVGNVGYQSLGASVGAGFVVQGAYSGISLGTAQTIFFTANAAAGALSSSAYCTSYSI